MLNAGETMYALARRLFPICRSITGNGVRETFSILRESLPDLTLHSVPTGTKAFDWTVPKEWNIRDAYIIDPRGRKIADFKESNLHVMGYSTPVNKKLSLEELQAHLYSLPDQPDAVPYITSYYKERWGFCITENQRKKLEPGEYQAVIDSELADGHLVYGELILPGESKQEVFLSTYICHPSMGNNELSGPCVATQLAQWLASEDRKYSYRIAFVPETIGSIVYLSRNLDQLQNNVIAGFNITCVGDERAYSYLPSRQENSLADQASLHVLSHLQPDFQRYSFLDRGSDERQYCSPGIDLPVASIMRSKYGTYPEYHTSLDNLDLISAAGLNGAYEVIRAAIECIEANELFRTSVKCEPQLGKRGLYPTVSTKETAAIVGNMMNLIAYADGERTLLEIATKIGVPLWELLPIVAKLKQANLIEVLEEFPA